MIRLAAACLCVSLIVAAIGCADAVDTELQGLAHDFAGSDWERVYQAADALESRSQQAVPLLIALLDRDEVVKLTNTADLIYPGTTEFYGHGLVISYDLDRIPARAGWLLEKITFHDFGFPNSQEVSGHASAISSGRLQAMAVKNAKTWWRDNGKDWTRLSALTEALRSLQVSRILAALEWLRHGESTIEGFDRDIYLRDVYPIVERLAKSRDEAIAVQAGYLVKNLADDEWYWLRRKMPSRD